jgi:hypothetical protein
MDYEYIQSHFQNHLHPVTGALFTHYCSATTFMILNYCHHAVQHVLQQDNEYDRKHEDVHSLMVP